MAKLYEVKQPLVLPPEIFKVVRRGIGETSLLGFAHGTENRRFSHEVSFMPRDTETMPWEKGTTVYGSILTNYHPPLAAGGIYINRDVAGIYPTEMHPLREAPEDTRHPDVETSMCRLTLKWVM